uniref:Cytochrome c oxidase subunit 1 n=2 Tax=Blastocrithidia TaxID=28004 RepID=A0AAT9UQ48_9TRYP
MWISSICLTISHKIIGLCYLFIAILCGFVGYVYSLCIRLELSVIGCGVLFGDYQFYNVLITSHGLIMIFAFIMPVIMGGFSNYFSPLIAGFPDMAFPRLNNMSFWMFVGGFICLVTGFLSEEGMGVGWTLYPTLICVDFHSSLSCDFVLFAVHFLGISSILNSINFIGTLLCCRRKYFSILSFTLFLWGALLTSILLIATLPVLAGGVTLIICDRNFNTSFYDVVGGGDLLLFQHLFWFFGHPEVYIIILPIFGLISTLIEIFCLRTVFSSISMIYSMIMISILGAFVWAHHMFVVGMDVDSRAYFGAVTALIGLPTGIKLFNWIYSFFFVDLLLHIESFYIFCFIFMFLMGGVTGLFLANIGIDIMMHDTYFVVAHFHYVLSLGAVFGFFAGFFHFINKWINLEINLFFFWIFLINLFFGANMIFLPMHSYGLYGCPRRITDFPICFIFWNSVILFGILLITFVVLFLSVFFSYSFLCNACLCLDFWSSFNLDIFVTVNIQIVSVLYLILVDFLHLCVSYLFVFLNILSVFLVSFCHFICNFLI